MNLLLDTHVFLWWLAGDARLGPRTRETIAKSPAAFVSVASAWEAAIKIGLGRLRMPESFERGIEAGGFRPLPITFEHAEGVAKLPRHHGDPFDRMLVSQALCEGLRLVTADRAFTRYGLEIAAVDE